MKTPRLLCSAYALLFIGCHYYPRDTGIPAASPCPKPSVDTSQWTLVTVSECAVRLKLPKGYKFVGGAGSFDVREWVTNVYDSGEFNFVEFAFFPNGFTSVEKSKPPDDAEGLQQCSDIIDGHTVVNQSYRSLARDLDPKHKAFAVQADILTSDGTVQIISLTSDVHLEQQVLAAIRTVEFIPRSPRPPRKPISKSEANAAALAHILSRLGIPLTGYFIVVVGGGYFIFRRKARQTGISKSGRRALVALYFALCLTPGMFDDFLFFEGNAPAVFNLFTFWPSFFYVDLAGWSQVSATGLRTWMPPIFVIDLVSILLGFAVLYGVLTIYVRLRTWRRSRVA